jgi:putative copper resistance protein D
MTTDWLYPAVRWASYGDLGLLFGVPVVAYLLLTREERDRLILLRRLPLLLAGAGLVLAAAGFVLLTADMAGVAPAAVDPALLQTLAMQAGMGWAWLARCAALVSILLLGLIPRLCRLRPLVPLPAATAVGTLAWSGHGNATGGPVGYVHLAGDIVHLLAASAWLGGIALLLALVLGRKIEQGTAARALVGFAPIGSLVVALLLLSGIANLLFLVAPADLPGLGSSLYGRLLLVKVGLFALMLGLAAANRLRLAPALGRAGTDLERAAAARRMSRSLGFELILAIAIFALVAWFGRLEP